MSMQLLTPRSDRYEHKKRDKRLSQYANIRVAQREAYQHRDKAQTTDTFLGIPCRQVTYQVPSKEEREKMRDQFNEEKRAEFVKYLATTQREALKRAGISDKQIENMRINGWTPHGFNTHHKLPIHGGGTNDFSNLVLVRREPWHDMMHYHLINQQVKNMNEGDSRVITIPDPGTPVFSAAPQYKFLEKWYKKGRKTYGKNKNTTLDEVEAEAAHQTALIAARGRAGAGR